MSRRKGTTKNISIAEKDLDILDYINSKNNFSAYVIKLIREDMKGDNTNLETMITTKIKDILGCLGIDKKVKSDAIEEIKADAKQEVEQEKPNNYDDDFEMLDTNSGGLDEVIL